ncbi:dUTP diphosphatase [Methylotenera sp.]|uniref:dUTP diphosphatase n=1 Tax=Methylotenera sp. TaxID=2051956 RepID=UPI002488C44F|nr:dUTP diphosphatase [Methylotenera sp.]MDI1360625.1 dUTP diphosphatase [Methylotenera sp.]
MKTNQTMMQEMLKLQNSMNNKVSPEWASMGWNWYRAIWLESAEAVEQMPWKWWKHTTTDESQVKMEIVDIWHFILSLAVEGCHEDELTDDIGDGSIGSPKLFMPNALIANLESLAAAALSSDMSEVVLTFKDTLDSSGMDLAELYSLYIGKNVLNMFRQDNGYKKGTYRKLWNGVEDNKRLVEVMMNANPLAADYANDIYRGLEAAYKEVV